MLAFRTLAVILVVGFAGVSQEIGAQKSAASEADVAAINAFYGEWS